MCLSDISIQGAFADQHFDQDLNFHATEEDPVTKKVTTLLLISSLSHCLKLILGILQ